MNLPKAYEPNKYEDDIYKLWESSNAFTPSDKRNDGYFSIVVPPPNANGDLHIGHGLNHAIMDIAVRFNRMNNHNSLLLPGADHAGFETQVVYEKILAKKGKSRFDFTREELYQQIWDFVALNRDNFESQFRKLGDSVDWSRHVFTLDKKIVNTAYKTFKKMWDEDLIYRGERLVNFCTHHGTGFADIEVEYKQVDGKLWQIKYPLTASDNYITIATTRPETLLGDTAVAVHPNDKRYKNLIGKTVKLPLTNREIPIIADEFVDPKFGTGAVKITPAHDPNDFEAGKRHDLPMITVINHEGRLPHAVPEPYQNLTVKDARKAIINDLRSLSLLVKEEDYTHSVGHCYKCGTVIEPLLREQWFIDMQPLAKRAIKSLKNNEIKFYPKSKQTQLIKYLENLKDWNISRQIAWGIPIPAFQNTEDPEDWVFDKRTDQEFITINGNTYKRDPDVFDTWFSSSSWPYATLDYPSGKDFDNFYPISLMETGADILYPWVSRMIMFGLYITNKIPFKEVYLHGLIQDEKGAKMSKSKGNVINPIQKIEQFGSDAFRMGIIADEAPGINRPYDESKLIGARNFCNKIWNMARYIQANSATSTPISSPNPQTPADHWALSILQHSSKKLSVFLEQYRFSDAYDLLYHTIWNDIADWYIEASKNGAGEGMLSYTLDTILKLAHPFAPFLTETIWQNLGWNKNTQLIAQPWPTLAKHDNSKVREFVKIKTTVTEIRQLSKNLKLTKPTLTTSSDLIYNNAELIIGLAKLGEIQKQNQSSGVRLLSVNGWLSATTSQINNYQDELELKLKDCDIKIFNLVKRLDNREYVANAPAQIVKQTKDQLVLAQNQLNTLKNELARLKS
jgi:valyl-tRNA synthetase